MTKGKRNPEPTLYDVMAVLTGMDARFDGIDTRLDTVDTRLDGIDIRLDRMDKKFEVMHERMNGIDERLGGVEHRLGKVEVTVLEIQDELRASLVAPSTSSITNGASEGSRRRDSLRASIRECSGSTGW